MYQGIIIVLVSSQLRTCGVCLTEAADGEDEMSNRCILITFPQHRDVVYSHPMSPTEFMSHSIAEKLKEIEIFLRTRECGGDGSREQRSRSCLVQLLLKLESLFFKLLLPFLCWFQSSYTGNTCESGVFTLW